MCRDAGAPGDASDAAGSVAATSHSPVRRLFEPSRRPSSRIECASGLMLMMQPKSSAAWCQRQSRSRRHGWALISPRPHVWRRRAAPSRRRCHSLADAEAAFQSCGREWWYAGSRSHEVAYRSGPCDRVEAAVARRSRCGRVRWRASWCVSVISIVPVECVSASGWSVPVADSHGGYAMKWAFPNFNK